MSIRRQSIISSMVIYLGFVVGLLNTYFFTKHGLFTDDQYGLISIFMAIASMMMAFASLAMPAYIAKFYPYYKDNLSRDKNDMLTWALLISSLGFILVMVAGYAFKHLIIRKFGENSPSLIQFYSWIFPMGLGLTIYTVLEVYAWYFNKSVLTNFLKEVQWRLLTTVLIVLFLARVIPDFSLFIKLYSFCYPCIALTLFLYLVFTSRVHITFKISKVSRRFFQKILRLCSFVYASTIIFTLSQVFDTIVIASVLKDGTAKAGIFGLAVIMCSVIQAPQRGVISASLPHLSRAWKEKNMALLQKVYQRSSISMLIFASGIFVLIALNYKEAILTFGLKEIFLRGFDAFILLGLIRVVDMGTGVNSQIIATSNYWRFELTSGIILLVFMLPLTYVLTKQYDILGPAIATLVSVTIYNAIRIIFLWSKFRLFPFTMQSIYTLLLAGSAMVICYFLFLNIHGFAGLILRSVAFLVLYVTGVVYFRLSPDLSPVWQTVKKRFRLRKD